MLWPRAHTHRMKFIFVDGVGRSIGPFCYVSFSFRSLFPFLVFVSLIHITFLLNFFFRILPCFPSFISFRFQLVFDFSTLCIVKFIGGKKNSAKDIFGAVVLLVFFMVIN